jgi:hypothetical protein
MGDKVILDGRQYYEGHKDAWRSGEIVGEIDVRGPTQEFVTVECQPRGRERNVRRLTCCAWHLLRDTPELRAKLAKYGIDPSSPPTSSTEQT